MGDGISNEPLDEAQRLRELHALGILDTPPEARFERFTELAADLFGVPFALVTLIDRDRQWSKSAVGVAPGEIAREESFCTHALPHGQLEVPDARADPRFKHNPVVVGKPCIRFYAGAVLHGPTGQPLGTLCLLDCQPRRLSAAERSRLRSLAALVEHELIENTPLRRESADASGVDLYHATTGLPDAPLLEAQLDRSLAEMEKSGRSLAVVHLHIRNQEALIALVGQAGSNRAIQMLTDRLQELVRDEDRVGHLGPDRLGLILPGRVAEAELVARLRPLLARLAAPVEIEGTYRPIQIVAGASRYPADTATAATLLDFARTAAAQATAGSEAIQCYSRYSHACVSRRLDQQYRLSEALPAGVLRQVYQPILASADQATIAVEALARWHDPVYGDISPATFVPLAESDPDLRRALTQWSLDKGCRQLAAWRANGAATLAIAVNIPGDELYSGDFVARIKACLSRYHLPPSRLILEITEHSLIADVDAATQTMTTLHAAGVRWAIDDFGTGYSSLGYLRELPLDHLKLDRCFIRGIEHDATVQKFAGGIVALAQTLDLSVVAEGVETNEQYQRVRTLGCEYAQGFGLGRPGDAETIAARVCPRRNGADTAAPAGTAAPPCTKYVGV